MKYYYIKQGVAKYYSTKFTNYFENHRQATRKLVALFKNDIINIINEKMHKCYTELNENNGNYLQQNELENGIDFYCKILAKYSFERKRDNLDMDRSSGSYFDLIYTQITKLLVGEVEKSWRFVGRQDGLTYTIGEGEDAADANLKMDFNAFNAIESEAPEEGVPAALIEAHKKLFAGEV
jgi:hypothetical protein